MISESSNIRKPSICFVAPDAYPGLVGENDARLGGAEIQQVIIARELWARGYRVSFVTEDHGQQDGMEAGGIRVFKGYRRSSGVPVVRFVYPRMVRLWAAMMRSDADIYFQRTSDAITGIVAAFSRKHNRKFVFSVASNADCQVHLPHCAAHERRFYRYGLRRANSIIAHTFVQQRMLR